VARRNRPIRSLPNGTLLRVPLIEFQCQTENVPLVDGNLVAETLIAFLMIGLLGFVLRWTFARDKGMPMWPPAEPSDSDDFGLLAPVATVDTADEAARLRAMLAEAGIKATTTAAPAGRYRVLVFSSELDRARRVGGWSA
jgi:hypothetical protein